MKRTLIIPATIALLTGMAATAQEPNEAATDVNASASVEMTGETENLDELSIEELNALQLKVLEAPNATEATEDMIFSVQSETDAEAETSDSQIIMAETDTGISAETEMTTDEADIEADIETDAEMGMGGPDYASEADAMANDAMQGTIADLASEDPRFTTLVALVEQAGLTAELDGDAEYTVFAPTNAAFEKLDPELVTRLKSGNANDELKSILKAHVVEGETLSTALTDGETQIATLAEIDLAVSKMGDSVTVGNATVVEADIDASNGVIHAVDTVIVPADKDIDTES
ncbi:fasciclin domain-containing protein [Hyphomonas sp.]|uniref:fasciclin domain-containing protein n=1 Tax=Hyphomonas sp. TaxID=87 RepID=UPI0025BDFDDC|nr:fasciclin domain-containing protein [Hyphomonas sp.]